MQHERCGCRELCCSNHPTGDYSVHVSHYIARMFSHFQSTNSAFPQQSGIECVVPVWSVYSGYSQVFCRMFGPACIRIRSCRLPPLFERNVNKIFMKLLLFLTVLGHRKKRIERFNSLFVVGPTFLQFRTEQCIFILFGRTVLPLSSCFLQFCTWHFTLNSKQLANCIDRNCL